MKTDRGCVVIDGYGRTNVPGIYAIGDVAGPPMLAHKAEHEAVICVEKIAGLPNVHPLDKAKIPGCTYCNPQVASVGLTEAKAKAEGKDIRVGRFQFVANGKAVALGRGPGPGQDDLRQEDRPAARRAYGRRGSHRTDPGLRRRHEPRDHRGGADAHVFPHPTLSETMKESVLDAYGGKVLNAYGTAHALDRIAQRIRSPATQHGTERRGLDEGLSLPVRNELYAQMIDRGGCRSSIGTRLDRLSMVITAHS